jgi:hypothetical protein
MLQSHDAASAAIGSTVYAPQSGHTSLCYDLCVAKSGTLGCVDKPNPDPDGRKNDKGREALDEFVVASCDAP